MSRPDFCNGCQSGCETLCMFAKELRWIRRLLRSRDRSCFYVLFFPVAYTLFVSARPEERARRDQLDGPGSSSPKELAGGALWRKKCRTRSGFDLATNTTVRIANKISKRLRDNTVCDHASDRQERTAWAYRQILTPWSLGLSAIHNLISDWL